MHFRLLFLLVSLSVCLSAQDEYAITVDIDGYDEEYLMLANYLMDKQYIVDTAYRADDGSYTFSSDTSALPSGIYLVVLAPDNQYFQMLVSDDEDQVFQLSTRKDDLGKIEVEGSKENELFYNYLTYLDGMQKKSQPVRERLSDSTLTEALRAEAQLEMEGFDKQVREYQDELLENQSGSFTAAIISANRAATPPEFAEIEDEEVRREKQWRWLQENYFEGLNLKDGRLLRTPFLFTRIDYYINKLNVRHPDTIATAIDRVLGLMEPESELKKFYIVHFTNEAATSKIVGMDALYVHMVDNYYGDGKAWWADSEQVDKMKENADRIRPLLIGKTAPDIRLTARDGTPVNLYGMDSEYTVLYFWRYDCAACKKSTPHMKEFYEKWKDKGVKILAVCTKGEDELGDCWDYVDENETGDWVQAADPYQRYYRNYDIKSTPTIFLLDKDNTILSKRIGAEQLDEILTMITEQKAAEAAGK